MSPGQNLYTGATSQADAGPAAISPTLLWLLVGGLAGLAGLATVRIVRRGRPAF